MPIAHLDSALDLYYDDDCFADPWTTPEAIFMHHGLVKTARFWYAWVPSLAAEYRVVRVDCRGFGRSTIPPPGFPWFLSGFAREARDLLDRLGIERVHFIGESMGGMVGLQFAHDYPERLHSLTVCTAPVRLTGPAGIITSRDVLEKDGLEGYARRSLGTRLDLARSSPARVEWTNRQILSTAKHVLIELVTYLSTVDLADMLPRIRVPTLCIFGEQSAKSGTFAPEEMRRLIPGSRLEIVPGASGFVQHSEPARCVALWREFVGKWGPA